MLERKQLIYFRNITGEPRRLVHGLLTRFAFLSCVPSIEGFTIVRNDSVTIGPGQAVCVPMSVWNTGRCACRLPWAQEITRDEFLALAGCSASETVGQSTEDADGNSDWGTETPIDPALDTSIEWPEDWDATINMAALRDLARLARVDAPVGIHKQDLIVRLQCRQLAADPERLSAVALACYEANTAYCAEIGDPPRTEFETVREGTLSGIVALLEDPEMTPEANHEHWLEYKRESGWVWGEVIDLEAKTHPCILPYADLPETQQHKDLIFRETVMGFVTGQL